MKMLNKSAATRLPQEFSPIHYLTSPGISHIESSPINKKDYPIDENTNQAKFEKGSCRLVLIKGQPIGLLGRKLLEMALSILRNNHNDEPNISITLKDFAQICGIDINNKPLLDKFRRNINKELESIFNARISWKAKRGYYDGRIISGKGIVSGKIIIVFEQKIAKYLKDNPLVTLTDKRIMSCDNRNANLWSVYNKLIEHSFIPNNVKKGTKDIISIKSLIKTAIDIPNIEVVRNTNRDYRQRIIEPLDKLLIQLEELGWIKFEYCHAKKEPLPIDGTQPCDMRIDEYEALYVRYEILKNPLNLC